jgi:dienelactone hydrolase
MSGDLPTLPDGQRPVSGTASGTAYLALPPTAVDARPSGATRLVLAWPGFVPPRTASALAAVMPMTGVPTWRVYLEPPGAETGGLDSSALLETQGMEAYGTAVERAVDDLPATLDAIRRDLGLDEGPVGLAGFSFGATAALLALARGIVPVSAAALVTPVLSPARAAASLERRAGRDRDWTAAATAMAERLDLTARVAELAARDAAVLLIAGARDRLVPPGEVSDLCERLRERGARVVEAATFRMGHALASEPGTTAQPPTTEAVRVDGVLNDWFREHLATVTEVIEPEPPPEHSSAADLAPADKPRPSPRDAAAEPDPLAPLPRRVRTPMGEPPAAGPPATPRMPSPPASMRPTVHIDGSTLEPTTPERRP